MAPKSQEMSTSLGGLSKQIEEAERLLRRMPGIENETVLADASEPPIYLWLGLAEDRHGTMKLAIKATWESNVPMDLDTLPPETQFLDDMRVADKIKFAEAIPALMELCIKRSEEMSQRVDALASRIEQAVAKAQKLPSIRADARDRQNAPRIVRVRCISKSTADEGRSIESLIPLLG